MNTKTTKIAVAMSGGVDSSVAAALLVRAGHDVIGLFAKTWTPQPGDGTSCGWVAERRDALRVAAALDIPLITIDAEEVYRTQVVDPWVAGYGRGETPNPDVWCNRTVKFGVLVERARELGAEALATGHYARLQGLGASSWGLGEQRLNKNVPVPSFQSLAPPHLLRGTDADKDQSYFLWDIRPDVLPFIQFPIGEMKKTEVRRLARQFKLPVAEKKDSQGVCLLGPTQVGDFLRRRLPARPGPIYDWETGEEVGEHTGMVGYTVGQRHGVRKTGDRRQNPEGAPQYVVKIDTRANSLTLGPKRALEQRRLVAGQMNWLAPAAAARLAADETLTVDAQIRYRQRPTPAVIRRTEADALDVTFATPVTAPTPGQSVVFYDDNRLLGGAVIKETQNAKLKTQNHI